MTDKGKQSIQILTILKWIAKFVIYIIIYHLVVVIFSNYRIYYLPQVKKGYYIHPVVCKEGNKILPIHFKKDFDTQSWVEILKFWGYIKDRYEEN